MDATRLSRASRIGVYEAGSEVSTSSWLEPSELTCYGHYLLDETSLRFFIQLRQLGVLLTELLELSSGKDCSRFLSRQVDVSLPLDFGHFLPAETKTSLTRIAEFEQDPQLS